MPRTIKDIPNLPEVADKKARAKEMPVLQIDGDAVQRYNSASDQKKKAETVMQELRPELVSAGLMFIFRTNCSAADDAPRIKSVRLKQVNAEPERADVEEAEICVFTLSDKANKLDRDLIDTALTAMKRTDGKPANANDYVEWGVKADFDTSLFYDRDGNWVQSRFDKVQAALIKVAEELKCLSPLSCAKELRVKPAFFQRRYTDFTPRQNIALNKVIPCTASLEPVRKEEKE